MSEVKTDLFARGGYQPDLALLAAEQELNAARAKFMAKASDLTQEEDDALWGPIEALQTLILHTSPSTLAGCAVKLRLIADPDIGMEIGDRFDGADVLTIRQVLATISDLSVSEAYPAVTDRRALPPLFTAEQQHVLCQVIGAAWFAGSTPEATTMVVTMSKPLLRRFLAIFDHVLFADVEIEQTDELERAEEYILARHVARSASGTGEAA